MDAAATETLLTNLLDKVDQSVIVRALLIGDNATVRDISLKAASAVAKAAVSSKRADTLCTTLEAVLDKPPAKKDDAKRILTTVLKLFGELAAGLTKEAVLRVIERCSKLFGSDSHEIASSASRAGAAVLKAAIKAGTINAGEEPLTMLNGALEQMAGANDDVASRTAASAIAASAGALGEAALVEHGVVAKLTETLATKSKTAANARECAALAVGQLCITLRHRFEPYSIPLFSTLVQAFADKDKKFADGAAVGAKDFIFALSPLSVKMVLPALYEGMQVLHTQRHPLLHARCSRHALLHALHLPRLPLEHARHAHPASSPVQVVGGGGRSKVECCNLASLLAKRAPRTFGPCLFECIPLVMECLNDSNAKVQAAAELSLQELITCVENAEISKTLKDRVLLALRVPDSTLDCIDEVLMTTFCNPMDGAALSFTVPILVRGIKDANYELVKKATVCTSNLCALTREASDVAPFVPILLPLLQNNSDHSSPEVRAATETAVAKLLDGAGDVVDPNKRIDALAALVKEGIAKAFPAVPAAVLTYLGGTSAAMLEEKLGGVVRVQNFIDAVKELATWFVSNIEAFVGGDAAADAAAVSGKAVELFKDMLSDSAKAILAQSGDKDFAVDIQNIILAFAGRVLLRKADIRFERGHRYGLIGQNGTGKTTLLNRLAAKDITGFPTELRTFYIRHEVLCDDGVVVKDFLKLHAPSDKLDKDFDEVLEYVELPQEHRAAEVNSLSVGFKMKLSVAISILHEPELLLLDEPTNHCDPQAIEWLAKHLQTLEGVTMAVVSHDYDFIDAVCTDITHYDNNGVLGTPCKFNYYPMTFGQFQTLKPEIAAGLPRHDGAPMGAAKSEATESEAGELADDMDNLSVKSGSSKSGKSKDSSVDMQGMSTLAHVDEMIEAGLIRAFRMPDPGKPDGIRTFRKPIMTLKDVSFKYPGSEKYILEKVSASMTLGSRTVIVGGNGSGKSTFLQLLIGDLEAEEGTGEHWKHHNLRLSYVAQQSMHHLEEHLQSNPIQYIQQRFREGLDKEIAKLKTIAITKEP